VTFALLAIRTADEEDASLYPVLGDPRMPVRLDACDGNAQRLTAKGLSLSEQSFGRRTSLAGVRDVKIDVVVTDARVAFTCAGHAAGVGWVGARTGAVAASVSARRRKGSVLVGQVRYPWLRAAGFLPGGGWLSEQQIRLAVTVRQARADRELLLDLQLPRGVSAEALCRALVSRAARHRLTRIPCEPDEQRSLVALLDPPMLPRPGKSGFAIYELPGSYLVEPCLAGQSSRRA
jgi:hypothetical protein